MAEIRLKNTVLYRKVFHLLILVLFWTIFCELPYQLVYDVDELTFCNFFTVHILGNAYLNVQVFVLSTQNRHNNFCRNFYTFAQQS